MGIDLATWRARIGLNYYHMCRPLQTRWRSSGGRLYRSGVASWGVGEVMNDTPLVLKGCMTVVALALLLQYVVHSWSKLKGRGGGGKVRCHWLGATSQVRGTVDGGGTQLLRAIVVVIPLLLVVAGDVETNPGPGEPTLKALLTALHPIRAGWYNIGLELDIPHTELDCFKQKYSDPTNLMCEVLKYWFRTAVDPRPSWEAVVGALRSPLVNEMNVAEQLESKYCTQTQIDEEAHEQATTSTVDMQSKDQPLACTASVVGRPTTSIAQHTASNSQLPSGPQLDIDTDGSTSASSSEEFQKPPFGCGCGNCTLSSFIERGCPKPISSENSFLNLNLSELTDKQKEDLRDRLRFESQEVMMQFQKLVSATIESLIRQNVALQRLVSHIMTLGAFDPVYKKPQVPLFQDRLKELETAEAIPKIFLVLKDYFSFFNYDIIEHIIEMLGTKEDIAKLQDYKDKFDQYVKRRIFECGPNFGPESETDHASIVVKLDSRYDNYTGAEIKRFCRRLSEILHVSSKGVLRLCRVDKGCIELRFQVPSFVQQKIFPLSRVQEKALEAEGVLNLACEKYQFQDSTEKPWHYASVMEIGDTYCSSEEQGGMRLEVNLDNLLKVLHKVTDVVDLGLHLGVQKHELDKIRKKFHEVNKQKREMLKLWLHHTLTPTWGRVIAALRSMNKPKLADAVAMVSKWESLHATPGEQSQRMEENLKKIDSFHQKVQEVQQRSQHLEEEWEKGEKEWREYLIKLERIEKDWEDLVKYQRTQRAFLTLGISLIFQSNLESLHRYSLLEKKMQKQMARSKELRKFHEDIREHQRGLQNTKNELSEWEKKLYEYAVELEKDIYLMEELGERFAGEVKCCHERLEESHKELQTCREKIDKCKDELTTSGRRLEDCRYKLIECEVSLIECRDELGNNHKQITNCIEGLKKNSTDLSQQIGNLTVTVGAAGGASIGTIIGSVGGPVGSTFGAVIGAAVGLVAGAFAADHHENQLETKRKKLREVESELTDCGNVVERCREVLRKCEEELRELKRIVSELEQTFDEQQVETI